jgi:hypothetical protein
MKTQKPNPTQFERFIETARSLGCDEDKEHFEAQLGKIAAHKPEKEPIPTKQKRPDKKPSRLS